MMSPQCSGGCAERPNADPVHYFYHRKTAEICIREERAEEAERHNLAADWLGQHDMQGKDPLRTLSAEYTIPTGATIIPVWKEK